MRKNSVLKKLLSKTVIPFKALIGYFRVDVDHSKEDGFMTKRAVLKQEDLAEKRVLFAKNVLDDFRKNVGTYPAETGGLLASTKGPEIVDLCHFDSFSKNTKGSFYYDVESMSRVFKNWKTKGYTTNGIYHSHPKGVIRPSYHDISSALLHIDFLNLSYFYLPIIMPEEKGCYRMYFYIVHKKQDKELEVKLYYVLQANEESYEYVHFEEWEKTYSIENLNSYRKAIDQVNTAGHEKVGNKPVDKPAKVTENKIPTTEYFKKVAKLYPDKVLDKVLICIGTGGARSFLENLARCGFRNFILMDKDVVSPSNIATQGVFISEMGKKKIEVIKNRILDINPEAKVICVDKFLDDEMSDAEFRGYMDLFPDKRPTDYLIMGCTDHFEAQKRSSMLALKYGTPYLAAMMYEEGNAAEVLFIYPGVTQSCPRCLLRSRFEKYENGFKNDVESSSCPIFATERMNSLKGYISIMLLMYGEDSEGPFSKMLDEVKDRNFLQIRLNPHLKDSKLGIDFFDKVLAPAVDFTYFDETLWLPQRPDREEFGTENCKWCGGGGDLRLLQKKWKYLDTRGVQVSSNQAKKAPLSFVKKSAEGFVPVNQKSQFDARI